MHFRCESPDFRGAKKPAQRMQQQPPNIATQGSHIALPRKRSTGAHRNRAGGGPQWRSSLGALIWAHKAPASIASSKPACGRPHNLCILGFFGVHRIFTQDACVPRPGHGVEIPDDAFQQEGGSDLHGSYHVAGRRVRGL